MFIPTPYSRNKNHSYLIHKTKFLFSVTRNQININLKMSGLQFIQRKWHIKSGQIEKKK